MFLKVEHVMTREVVTIESGSSLRDAVDIMNEREIGCVVIVDKGKAVGIVTERDLLKRVLAQIEEVKRMKVDDIMSQPIIAGRSDEDVEDAARRMLAKKIKKMPVVENDKLVGIVTLTDLFRFEPELIKSYTILMRARTEPNVLDPGNMVVNK